MCSLFLVTIASLGAFAILLCGASLLHVRGEVLAVNHCEHTVQSKSTRAVAVHIQGLNQRGGVCQPGGFNDHPIQPGERIVGEETLEGGQQILANCGIIQRKRIIVSKKLLEL